MAPMHVDYNRPAITTYSLGEKLPQEDIMKKFVLMLDLQEDTDKRKALKAVSTLSGINEITIDVKAKKLIVIGTVDPVMVVSKLRKKNWATSIISVGPAKEEEKKENPKKEEEAKEKKPEPQQLDPATLQYRPYYPSVGNYYYATPQHLDPATLQYRPYYPSVGTYYYTHHSIEENPNVCVIS